MKRVNTQIRRTDKLVLHRETVLVLSPRQLGEVAGGSTGCNVSRGFCAQNGIDPTP